MYGCVGVQALGVGVGRRARGGRGLTWFQVDGGSGAESGSGGGGGGSGGGGGGVHVIHDRPVIRNLAAQLLGFEVENVRIMRVWT